VSFDDLIAYLDTRFRETAQQFAALEERTSQQFAALEERMDTRFHETAQQFAALEERMDTRFRETAQQFAALEERTSQQFAALEERTSQQITSLREELAGQRAENNRRFEQLEEAVRHTQVTVEHLDGKIRLVAEGVSNVNEKLDTVKTELKDEIGEVRDLLMRSRRIG
jgi:chromosome segregation ATPase